VLKRLSLLVFLTLLVASPLSAKEKKKPSLPELVLRAHTVVVVIAPGAGEPLDHPMGNATARENVEKALMNWGRLDPRMEGEETDLVIAVRTGTGRIAPTIRGGPIDSRPGVGESTDSSIRIGAQQGHAPPLSDPSAGPQDNAPHIDKTAGSPEDSFEVYLGGTKYPLDSAPVWRYSAKDCLQAPTVSAVEEFRKAIAESEQLQKKKP